MIIQKHGRSWYVREMEEGNVVAVSVWQGQPDRRSINETIDWVVQQKIKTIELNRDDYYGTDSWCLIMGPKEPEYNEWGEVSL